MADLDPALVPVLPRTAELTPEGHLALGGCDAVELTREFGTPLYVFDEAELRQTCLLPETRPSGPTYSRE